jgi:transposase
VFRVRSASGGYHGQVNADNSEKWLNEIVIPKLQPASVFAMDNVPYHRRQADKQSSASALKKMINWLERHGVQCDSSVRKATLYTIINSIKPKENMFRINKHLESQGHFVVRLPPNMCKLSPIELTWAKLKRHARSRNTTADMSMKQIEELVMEGLNEITAADWLEFSQHVPKLEQEFWANDGIMEDVTESFIITLSAGDSSSDSDSDSKDNGDSSDSECDSPLELPLDEESND